MRLTAAAVMEQTFSITFRGFDPAEVDAFLQRVADELSRLAEERDRLASELDEERRHRRTLEQALAAARTLQEGMMEKARQEADILVEQARLRADRILAEANEELLGVRRELARIRERRALWLADAEALGQSLVSWAGEHRAREPREPDLIADEEPAEADAGPGEGGGGERGGS